MLQKKEKKSRQEVCRAWTQFLLSRPVMRFLFALGEGKNLKGNAGFRSRSVLERKVIYTSHLSKQWLRVELSAWTLRRSGTYIKSRGASARWADAVINHGAGFDSSVAQAVWKMDSIYRRGCLRGFGRQPSISRLSPKEGTKRKRISFHHLPRQVAWFSVAQ